MADIGDIHDVLYLVAVIEQSAFEDIFKNVGAEITDVSVIVDGGAAGVEADFVFFDRLKFFEASV